jgi:GNAT superfamily N-acetyltransferase
VSPSDAGDQTSCVVRRATSADADILFELVQQFTASFRPQRQAFDVCLRELDRDRSAWIAVAECQDAVVGYCVGFDHFAFFAGGKVAWVEEIMVRPHWRRKGVGARLMTAFENWARSRGAKLVALATRRAAPFYMALGYEDSAAYFRKLL